MPPSRSQRKSSAKKRPVRFLDNQRVRISKQKFVEIRDSEDFHALLAIGRVLNALMFVAQVTKEIDASTKTAAGRRARVKNFQLAASYVHEALQVFASLRSRYGSEGFFAGALELVYPKDSNNRDSKILKLIRDSSGFHLDHERKATGTVLSNLNLKEYVLLSSDGEQMGQLCVDMADTVDLNFWIDKFKNGRSEGETFLEISRAVTRTLISTINASDKILTALIVKLGLSPMDV